MDFRRGFCWFLLIVCCFAWCFAVSLAKDSEIDSTDHSAQPAATVKPKSKAPKDWRKLKLEDVDKEWEAGDEEEELEDEFERIQKIKQSRMPKIHDGPGGGAAIAKAVKENPLEFAGGGGGHMVFITLKDKQLDGSSWDKKSVDKLSARWAGLASTAGLPSQFYNIDDKGGIMVQVSKAWLAKDVLTFLSHQPEVVKFYVNNKNYFPKDFIELDDEDEEDEDDGEL